MTESGQGQAQDVLLSVAAASECSYVMSSRIGNDYITTFASDEPDELERAVRQASEFLHEVSAFFTSVCLPVRSHIWIYLDDESFDSLSFSDWVASKTLELSETQEFFKKVL